MILWGHIPLLRCSTSSKVSTRRLYSHHLSYQSPTCIWVWLLSDSLLIVMYIGWCIACTYLLVVHGHGIIILGSCCFQDLFKMLCPILITLFFAQHQWQSWTRSLRSCTRSSWRRTSTCLPLCRSTRSSAPPTTSRRCFISPARHHCADIRPWSVLPDRWSWQLRCIPARPFFSYTLLGPVFECSVRVVRLGQTSIGDCMYSYVWSVLP